MLLCLTIIASVCTGCYNPPQKVFRCRLQWSEILQRHFSVGQFQLHLSQWCSSLPCRYSLGQPVAFQWHSNIHWTSQYTLAQGKGVLGHHWWFSNKSLWPYRRQAIIWSNAGILLIEPLGKNFDEMMIEIHTSQFNKFEGKCRLQNNGHVVSTSMCKLINGVNIFHWPSSFSKFIITMPIITCGITMTM